MNIKIILSDKKIIAIIISCLILISVLIFQIIQTRKKMNSFQEQIEIEKRTKINKCTNLSFWFQNILYIRHLKTIKLLNT